MSKPMKTLLARVMQRITYDCVSVLAAICLCSSLAQSATDDPLVCLGLHKQLLVDDHVLAEKKNLRRVLGQVTKANQGRPIIVADKPWESGRWGLYGFYGTVLHDGDKFRMWYNPWRFAVAYAESSDGLDWQKPALNLYDFSVHRANKETQLDHNSGFYPREDAEVDYRGKANNIIGVFGDGFTCYLDPHESDPDHRYKACYGHPRKIRACLAHSRDGIHWTPYNRGEPVTGRASDSYNQIVWDEDAKTYRLFTRNDFGQGDIEIRGTRGMVNPDLKADPTAWKTVRSWKFDREGPAEYVRRQIYSMTDWIYAGVHFALMQVYEWPDNPPRRRTGGDLFKRHERDVTNFYIATSRDGDSWDLGWVYAEQPLIARGPDGSFDKDSVFPSSNIVTWQDKHWIFYTGFRERHWQFGVPHKSAIGLATLPLDRFVGIQADKETGIATTHPFKLVGSRLILNADARAGNISVEVLDSTGTPIKGFSAKKCRGLHQVNSLRAAVNWHSQRSLALLEGQIIRLRFRLRNAKLFAFQVQP